MGLLDDAIREHLDLKRRRGADPAEIERAERDALGPVRRNRDPALAEDQEPVGAADLDPALGSARDEPDGGTASDLAEESYSAEEPTYAPGDAYDDEYEDDNAIPLEEDEARFADDENFAAGDEPFADEEDAHRTQVMQTVDPPPPDDATAVHDVEAAFADEEEPDDVHAHDRPRAAERPGDQGEEGEDVLEETPEFLQDTPDHDRLWFEQRPPRDFDFEG
ncbi:MAG: hypothetical protein ACRDK8_05350 [Solirubrobacteraceae bacterium]